MIVKLRIIVTEGLPPVTAFVLVIVAWSLAVRLLHLPPYLLPRPTAVWFFPILVNATRGLRDVDPQALDLFASLSAREPAIFSKLRVPNSLPYVFSALRVSSSLSIVGAIVGEFLGAQHGIGYAIVVA